MLYALQESTDGSLEWQPIGGTEWSEVHIIKDVVAEGEGTVDLYRIVAWTTDNAEAVVPHVNWLHLFVYFFSFTGASQL